MPKSDGSIEIDARISTENFKKNLKEMVSSAESSTDDIAEKGDKMYKAMQSATMKLAAEYKKAGMSQSEASKKAWAEVKKTAEYSSVMATKEAAKASKQVQKSAEEAAQGTQGAADKAGDTINQILGEIAKKADETYSDAGKKGENFADTLQKALSSSNPAIDEFSSKIKGALTVAGIAAGAAKIVQLGTDYEKAMNQVAASTGTAGQELENLQTISLNIYSNNFGESMEDAAAGVSEVYKRTGLIDEELQKATESAFLLKDTFGYEVAESTQAATQLMKVFGVTADEAYTLIAQGAQQGLDQNGDMLDTLNEYSVQFANLGYSAEDMFNMLKNGVDQGTWSVDKLGDAVKEMNIRLNDGTADKALESLGLNAESVKIKLSEGGESAKNMQQQILTSLMAVEDEQERYVLGQTLMGTMWEDLGEDAVNALMNTSGEISKTKNTLEEMNAIKYDDIGNQLEQLKRTAETEIIVPLTKEFMPVIKEIFSFVSDNSESLVNIIKPISGILKGIFSIANAALKPITAILSPILNLVGKFTGAIGDIASALAGTTSTIEDYNGTMKECGTEIASTSKALQQAKEEFGENSDEVQQLQKDLDTLNAQYRKGGGDAAVYSEKIAEISDSFDELKESQQEAMDAIDDSEGSGLRAVSMLEMLSGKTQLTSADLDTMSKYADYLNDTFNCNIEVDYDTGKLIGFNPDTAIKQIQDKINKNRSSQAFDYITNEKFSSSYIDAAETYYKNYEKLRNMQIEFDQLSKTAYYDFNGNVRYADDDRFKELSEQIPLMREECNKNKDAVALMNDEIEENGRIAGLDAESIEALQSAMDKSAKTGSDFISIEEEANRKISEQEYGIQSAKGVIEGYSEEIYKIAEAYDSAYESAYDSISNQFGLLSEAKADADATVDSFMEMTDSQLNFWDTYSKNLETLQSKSYEDLGISKENYDLLMELASKTDTESQSLISDMLANGDSAIVETANRLGELEDAHKTAAQNQALELSGIEEELDRHVGNIKEGIKKLDLSGESKDYAEATMNEYISGIRNNIINAQKTAQSLVDAVKNTFESADLTLNMSVTASSAGSTPKHAKGTTNAENVFIAGEEGPELIVGKSGSTVFPHSETAKIVGAVNSILPGADSAVAKTLSIMNSQGASSVNAASPVFKGMYAPTPIVSVPSAPPAAQPQSNVSPSFNIYIGDDQIRQFVVEAVTDANANTGGWSV